MTADATIIITVEQPAANLTLSAPVASADLPLVIEALDAQERLAMAHDGILGATLATIDAGLPVVERSVV